MTSIKQICLWTMNTLWFKIQIQHPFDTNSDTLQTSASTRIFDFKHCLQQRPCSKKVSFWHWWVKIKGRSLPSDTLKLLRVISLWCSLQLSFTFLLYWLRPDLLHLLLLKLVISCIHSKGFWQNRCEKVIYIEERRGKWPYESLLSRAVTFTEKATCLMVVLCYNLFRLLWVEKLVSLYSATIDFSFFDLLNSWKEAFDSEALTLKVFNKVLWENFNIYNSMTNGQSLCAD